MGWGIADWIHLAQDEKDKLINFRFTQNSENFLRS